MARPSATSPHASELLPTNSCATGRVARSLGAMREPATFCLALGIALAVLCHGCSGGSVGVGGGAVSDRAIVLYSREVSITDTARLVYAVVLRGRPGWHRPGVSYGFAASSWFGLWAQSTQTCITGTVRIEITYS